MKGLKNKSVMGQNKKAFFSMEALLGILVLVLTLSWMITIIMKSASLQNASREEEMAQSHIDFVLSNLQNAPFNMLGDGIRQGTWNYPNAPAIAAAGLVALPGESIITEYSGEGTQQVIVTVRWLNQNGEFREKNARVMIGGQ